MKRELREKEINDLLDSHSIAKISLANDTNVKLMKLANGDTGENGAEDSNIRKDFDKAGQNHESVLLVGEPNTENENNGEAE